jgi:hypothetical protein
MNKSICSSIHLLLFVQLLGDRTEVLEELDGLRQVLEVMVDGSLNFFAKFFLAMLGEVIFILFSHLHGSFTLDTRQELAHSICGRAQEDLHLFRVEDV